MRSGDYIKVEREPGESDGAALDALNYSFMIIDDGALGRNAAQVTQGLSLLKWSPEFYSRIFFLNVNLN